MPPREQVFGISMMKDEADVAYHTVMHMAEEGCDGIIVADNNSTDGTREELERAQADAPCPIIIEDDPEVGYYQADKMTRLAHRAADHGATWLVPFDADEIWYAEHALADVLRVQQGSVGVMHAALYNHFRTGLDTGDAIPFRSMIWRQLNPGPLPKVAFRHKPSIRVLQGNHGVEGTRGAAHAGLMIRHFPYRSWEHFKRKAENGAKAYEATDLPMEEGAHWRGYGEILARHGEGALKEVYDTYFDFLSPVNEGMVRDPAPFRRFNSR